MEVQKEIGRSSESKRRTQFPSLSLVTNMKVAKTQIIHSVCTFIVSQERNGLLILWLTCLEMEKED